MRYLSLFSGIGGFELGIQQAYEHIQDLFPSEELEHEAESTAGMGQGGMDGQHRPGLGYPVCVGYSEIDKYAIQIYGKHFSEHKNYGDITKIKSEDLPDFDLLCGGFPCQSFSIAGKRGGFGDTRGTLFFDICRIAKAKEPMFMLLENVKGLVSHDGGRTLEVILSSLQELGYYVNYEIRNSKDYGVPQNRERIFLLCKHIKLLSSVGRNEKITTSENIIQEWLFTLLLNNLAEVKKLQERASKDWVVAYLLLKEIRQNLEPSQLGNILGGISTPTDEGLFQSKVEVLWQSIDMCLKNIWVWNSNDISKFTISTALKQIIESKTYTYSTMLQAISLATVLLRQSSSLLWKEVLSNLIVIQEDTKYARINNKNEKAIITESGIAHLSSELQDPAKHFSLGHLRGTPRPQVFPFTRDDGEADVEPGTSSGVTGLNRPSRGPEPRKDGLACSIKAGESGTKNQIFVRGDPFIVDPQGRLGKECVPTEISPTLRANTHGNQPVVNAIRRLTPTECERLQGFPESEKKSIIEVCLDPQKSYVNVTSLSLKSQRLVGSVERNNSQESVPFAEMSLDSSDQQTNKLAQPSVLIDCVESGVEIHSQGKLLLNAKFAEKKNWSHQLISIDDFVHLLVGLNTMLEREIMLGKAESHQKEDSSIPLENGLRHENLSGSEIMLPVGDAESDSTTFRELLKFTTLDHSSTENSEQILKTLSLFVTRVIIGFIPKEILNQNIFTIEVKTRVGHTFGVSDTQRYKCLGNAVTVNVIKAIMERLIK